MKRFGCLMLACLFAALPLAGQQPEIKNADLGSIKGKGYKPLTPEQRRLYHGIARAAHGYRQAVALKSVTLPDEYDSVKEGFIPPVRDQGSCGSCYLVSTADCASMAYYATLTVGKATDDTFKISDQFGMDCHSFGGCNGGNGTEVIDWMCKNGFPSEWYTDSSGKKIQNYPAYEARSKTCRDNPNWKRYKPADWGFCTSDQSDRQATYDEICLAIYQRKSINIAFAATSAYQSAGSAPVRITSRNVDHETTAVGFNRIKKTIKTRGNWGTGLGYGGYVDFTSDSYIETPFWVSAGVLPPPPPPPDPIPPGPIPPGPTPVVLGNLSLNVDVKAGSQIWLVPAGSEINAVGTKAQLDDAKRIIAELNEKLNPKKVEPETKEPPMIEKKEEAKPAPKEEDEQPAEPEPPPAKTAANYEDQRARAIRVNSPLIVGVGCDAPKGEWLTVRVQAPFNAWTKECVIVSAPRGETLTVLATLPPGTTAQSVRLRLGK